MRGWMEVSLRIPKEYLEIVSNALIEQGASGIEEVEEEEENLSLLKAYFPVNEKNRRVGETLQKYFKSLKTVLPRFPSLEIKTNFIEEEDWSEGWKKYFKPIRVGSKLVVFPPWTRVRLGKGEIPILITPGMGFGTGTHSTTQLCMKALMKRLKRGVSVLDVGTGSGILSIVSARLGAKEVWGMDIDEEALELARENVKQNDVSKIVHIRKGGIGRIRKEFDLVVANIDFKTLWRIRNPLVNRLKPKGILILSGVLRGEEKKLRDHYLKISSLDYLEGKRDKEWVCLTFEKK